MLPLATNTRASLRRSELDAPAFDRAVPACFPSFLHRGTGRAAGWRGVCVRAEGRRVTSWRTGNQGLEHARRAVCPCGRRGTMSLDAMESLPQSRTIRSPPPPSQQHSEWATIALVISLDLHWSSSNSDHLWHTSSGSNKSI